MQAPDPSAELRGAMVRDQLERRGIRDRRVLEAFRETPREPFVPADLEPQAYNDSALPIGQGQTISQPFITALMLEALNLDPDDRVLEIGTGSGYSAALLSRLARQVYSIERIPELTRQAEDLLEREGLRNVSIRCGDGTLGWADAGPFDAILVTAGGPKIPDALVRRLAEGGRLVMPVGRRESDQTLIRILRAEDGCLQEDDLGPVRFVPLIGADAWDE